ncbi:hypothetical protein G6F56_012133 [Rhizopus delemar]|nr:hypothetical protein G6F56_012133 [Rhizopus delemar]
MSDLTNLLLQDILTSPNKAETILESLTTDQILKIESTIHRVKRRKLDKDKNQVTAIAHCLAAIVSAAMQTKQEPKEESPLAEMKDGVEYVSFMYSHNRTLKQYSIKTDINHIHLETIHDKFKAENCVYPRANLPREDYKGNRWSYETECNDLGWKLAWLNQEIAGKRGLIQRAVDSYRNRYPSMRSRRVARQEKLMNGTLRKRKHREFVATPESLEEAIVRPSHQPKTIAIDDRHHTRYRIKIGIEQVSLDEISEEFRRQNCPFPRATQKVEFYMGGRQRWIQENMLNELAWKLEN